MIDELLTDLKRDEGWVPHVYQDHLGYWTIGYGFLVDSRKKGSLPKKIAEDWLIYAATKRWNDVCAREPWLLDQPEHIQRALANMAYQLGVDGLLKFKKMLRAIKDRDYRWARIEALDSKWAVQTPERAKRIVKLLR